MKRNSGIRNPYGGTRILGGFLGRYLAETSRCNEEAGKGSTAKIGDGDGERTGRETASEKERTGKEGARKNFKLETLSRRSFTSESRIPVMLGSRVS